MRDKILEWLGLDIWARSLETQVGLCKILVQDHVTRLEKENQQLREENSKLLEAFIALKVKPPTITPGAKDSFGPRVPATNLVQALTAKAFEEDRLRREKEAMNVSNA